MTHEFESKKHEGLTVRLLSVRGPLLALFLLLVAISKVLGCGAATTNPSDRLGGESHFLRYCTDSCEGELACIGGICTQGCLLGTQGDGVCSALANAAICTSSSVEPGQVAVCDVECTADPDCAALGSDYMCSAGNCRAPDPERTTPNQCSAYRDQPGTGGVTMVVRNARSTPIYLKPFLSDCNDRPRLVQVLRDGSEVALVDRFFCQASSCETLLDNGDLGTCPAACTRAPLVRLNAGEELELGPFGTEFVSHGVLAGTEPMPRACLPTENLPNECYSQAPLAAGRYELTAQAFEDCGAQAGMTGGCECTEGSEPGCTTDAYVPSDDEYLPIQGGLTASATLDFPAATATLVFQP